MSLFADQERRVSVLLPLPLSGAYDYAVPPGMELCEGDFVTVPLGPRERTGVVWELEPTNQDVPFEKLKNVIEKLEQPPIPEASRKLVDWVARYTLQPSGSILKMVMSVPGALSDPAPKPAYIKASHQPEGLKLTKARERVLAFMENMPPMAPSDIAREAGCGTSVLKGLADLGALETVHMTDPSPFQEPDWQRDGYELANQQRVAADDLVEKTAHAGTEDGFSVTLLDGVPGSGKTEVYFEAVAKALEHGKQTLVLLPEIALSSQWLTRFKKRFGVEPAVWHSDIGQSMRKKTWRAIVRGQAKVIVGARSALFLPYKDLALIIVDEEHDASFKQEEGVIYNGRDMAVVRAQMGKCPVVLASATPSLETAVNSWEGRYNNLHMPSRHADVPLPDVITIDLRLDKPERQKWLSPSLIEAIKETVARGEQVMLYLNRRGYAPLTLCRSCGHRLQCPNCTSWLVEHRKAQKLQCHHCGYFTRPPRTCPSCESEDNFAACGPGVERLAEEVAETFPDLRAIVAASDTVTSPTQAAELVRKIEDQEVDLLIGTQMVAKGYHFPMLTLVGVVDADLGLSGGDLRASERTYQLLYQVAGRAGRADRPGTVMLQTFMPDHPVMKALKSGLRDRFLECEADARKSAGMPPFGRLAALIVSGEDEVLVDDTANALGRNAPHGQGILALGPAPAPLAMIRGRHRRRLLLKTDKKMPIQSILKDWLERTSVSRTVKIQIDIDPYSFL
ncbi:Primosomal protein N' [Candidatus Terasakiella magnetica]|uniref:Replication restart protein PriA n=1 Tax=Candidatus Terasakiella magnetica TaxID=1867952 RepID=A0A1C3RKK2_9PROT|nr:primosomal protein N' [Candidatus Terasakiella magnetica]SCA57751.1 Primosomal protein N' [Candidatus Terasakiella magnetica]